MGMSSAAIKTMQAKRKPKAQLSIQFEAPPVALDGREMCGLPMLVPELRRGLQAIQLARPVKIHACAPRWIDCEVFSSDGSPCVRVQIQPLRSGPAADEYVSWTADHLMPLGVYLILLDSKGDELEVLYPHPFMDGQTVGRDFHASVNNPDDAAKELARLIEQWEAAPNECYP